MRFLRTLLVAALAMSATSAAVASSCAPLSGMALVTQPDVIAYGTITSVSVQAEPVGIFAGRGHNVATVLTLVRYKGDIGATFEVASPRQDGFNLGVTFAPGPALFVGSRGKGGRVRVGACSFLSGARGLAAVPWVLPLHRIAVMPLVAASEALPWSRTVVRLAVAALDLVHDRERKEAVLRRLAWFRPDAKSYLMLGEAAYERRAYDRAVEALEASVKAGGGKEARSRLLQARLNLGATVDLSELDFRGIRIEKLDIVGSSLAGRDLHGATIADLKADQADLSGVDAGGMKGRAELANANLARANLSGARLYALMPGADLTGADLRDASFSRLVATGANLSGVKAAGMFAGGAELAGANLDGADLGRAVLRQARLAGASLKGTRLAGANLNHVDLGGLDLSGTDLSDATMEGATYDCGTRFPEGFNPSRHKARPKAGCQGFPPDYSGMTLSMNAFGYVVPSGHDSQGSHYRESDRRQLAKANLSGAILQDTDLAFSDLKGADLSGITGSGVLAASDLSGAKLVGANLLDVMLTGDAGPAKLDGADLTDASVRLLGINLLGRKAADLSGAVLTRLKITCTVPMLDGRMRTNSHPSASNAEYVGYLADLVAKEPTVRLDSTCRRVFYNQIPKGEDYETGTPVVDGRPLAFEDLGLGGHPQR